ncbi:hypothetical protein BJX96DRAFT_37770 [Aspergillus floccosus]
MLPAQTSTEVLGNKYPHSFMGVFRVVFIFYFLSLFFFFRCFDQAAPRARGA